MSRSLTAAEQERYPWATRINDFVPVGRVRKLALATAGAGVLVLIVGIGGLYLTAADVRAGVDLTGSTVGRVSLALGALLLAASFLVGLGTAVAAIVKSARSPLVWSLAAMAPGVVVAAIVIAVR